MEKSLMQLVLHKAHIIYEIGRKIGICLSSTK